MRFGHGNARAWTAVAFVTVAGLVLYRFIPQYRLASGTVTAVVIVLLVLKHVGLFSIFGAPSLVFFRSLRDRVRRRAADR
jgi:uncharacterized membrane protein YqjE